MPSPEENGSTCIGLVFIFNLIVGTGALTLPATFAKSGWLLSLIVVCFLAFVSFMTASFVIETIACANAIRNWQELQVNDETNESGGEDEELLGNAIQDSLPSSLEQRTYSFYRLEKKFELGEMATLFFNDFGRMVFYLCLVIYLYGDLSIYAAAVAKTLRDIVWQVLEVFIGICGSFITYSETQNDTHVLTGNVTALRMISIAYHGVGDNSVLPCWQTKSLTRLEVYRIFLVGFMVLLGPFVFAKSAQKTKYLQLLTVLCRWAAFVLMISIAIKIIVSDGVKGHPVAVNIYGVPPLFGACVYSFMCHHSLPSLIVPIRKKKLLHSLLFADYGLICVFYILLALTGIFAFNHLEDLYTLNFIPSTGGKVFVVIDYFLALFPVFTLSASFPIIAITLRNNLQTLFLDPPRFESYNFFIRRLLFPLAAILPPFGITYFTQSLTSLVSFTGSYAGNGIQYLIPVSLVYFARRTCKQLLGSGVINVYQSSFGSIKWLVLVMFWSLLCISFVTINMFY